MSHTNLQGWVLLVYRVLVDGFVTFFVSSFACKGKYKFKWMVPLSNVHVVDVDYAVLKKKEMMKRRSRYHPDEGKFVYRNLTKNRKWRCIASYIIFLGIHGVIIYVFCCAFNSFTQIF